MNITVSGLTGAGKTTYSQAIAEQLDLEYVSGASVRARLLGLDVGDPGLRREYWLRDPTALRADAVRLRPDGGEHDIDEEIRRLHDTGDGRCFDVWFMPWTARAPSVRIWLDAPFDVRVRRVAAQAGRTDLAAVSAEVAAKDERSHAYALKQYDFDLYVDRSPFTIVAQVVEGLGIGDVTMVLLDAINAAAGVSSARAASDYWQRVITRGPRSRTR